MPLTPADIHNASFSRPPIGKRGYNEAEVDRLLELVEDELVRHIEEKDELLRLNAALDKRDDPMTDLDATLRRWDGELRQQEAPLQKKAAELRQRDAELRQHEATLQKKTAELRQHEGALHKKSAEYRQRDAELRQQLTTLQTKAVELRRRDAELRRLEAAQYDEHASAHLQEGRFCQNGTAVRGYVDTPRPTVSEEQRITAVRTVARPRASRETEWTALRTVSDRLGNEVTETVQHQWTRTNDPGPITAHDEAAEMEQLQQQNAELNRVNNILKAAAALFATQIQEAEPAGGRELAR